MAQKTFSQVFSAHHYGRIKMKNNLLTSLFILSVASGHIFCNGYVFDAREKQFVEEVSIDGPLASLAPAIPFVAPPLAIILFGLSVLGLTQNKGLDHGVKEIEKTTEKLKKDIKALNIMRDLFIEDDTATLILRCTTMFENKPLKPEIFYVEKDSDLQKKLDAGVEIATTKAKVGVVQYGNVTEVTIQSKTLDDHAALRQDFICKAGDMLRKFVPIPSETVLPGEGKGLLKLAQELQLSLNGAVHALILTCTTTKGESPKLMRVTAANGEEEIVTDMNLIGAAGGLRIRVLQANSLTTTATLRFDDAHIAALQSPDNTFKCTDGDLEENFEPYNLIPPVN